MIIHCEFWVNRPVIDNRGCAKWSVVCRLLVERNETGYHAAGPQCQIIRLYTVSHYIWSVRRAHHYAHNSCVRVNWPLWVDDCLSVCGWWWWLVAESSARCGLLALRCDDIVSTVHFRCRRSLRVCFSFRSFRLAPLVDPTQRPLCGRSTVGKTSAANNKTL